MATGPMRAQISRAAGAAPDAGAPAGGPDDAGGPPVAAPEAMVIDRGAPGAAAPRERATQKSNLLE